MELRTRQNFILKPGENAGKAGLYV